MYVNKKMYIEGTDTELRLQIIEYWVKVHKISATSINIKTNISCNTQKATKTVGRARKKCYQESFYGGIWASN